MIRKMCIRDSLMTVAGTYQFRVRAIPKDTEETAYITSSDWVYSDELDIDADEVCTLSGGAVGGPDKADALTPSQLGWIKDCLLYTSRCV